MEGIAIMILYLIFGFFKNRNDKIKRKKIKSDPNWDSEEKTESDFNFNQILNSIIDDDINIEKNINDQEVLNIKNSSDTEKKDDLKREFQYNSSKIDQEINNKLKEVDGDKTYANKKNKSKKLFGIKFFKNKSSIKKAIILKEILDEPLGLRKMNNWRNKFN